ncbi:uncharacterized protein cfap92 [Brienomyrus brachyistius]|uniref:uncharacterized protein cfap92 n=1 Tax=Brienomyrus brachyistius TaxID=42636 RepID=UPI0020B29504|nr:uncharacterized protein cfap92 [Brienomyrus brachyistius]XP_048879291.1 uncharacterized protein cfap92 [Brienomyrus brachyistius]
MEFSDSAASAIPTRNPAVCVVGCPSPGELDSAPATNEMLNELVLQRDNKQHTQKSDKCLFDTVIDRNIVSTSTAESFESKSQPCYEITFTVTIALAIPKGNDESLIADREKTSKNIQNQYSSRTMGEKAPEAQRYYHIEYNLFPNDPEPRKVDLVMFGFAANIYLENETKVLKPWNEGDRMWLAWTQSVKLRVTRDVVIKLTSHRVTFRVWDTKDMVSAKAKRDRPSVLKLLQGICREDPEHTDAIKNIVKKLRNVFKKENPKSAVKTDKISSYLKKPPEPDSLSAEAKPSRIDAMIREKRDSSSDPKGECSTRKRSLEVPVSDLRSPRLELEREKDPVGLQTTQPNSQNARKQLSRFTINSLKVSCEDGSLVGNKRKQSCRAGLKITALTGQRRRRRSASVELNPVYLLAGRKQVIGCLATCLPGIDEGFCDISVDKPLLSNELRMELNPLVITIQSAKSLPALPVAFKEKCLPVYCKYKFHNLSEHRTKGQDHGVKVHFRDTNMILTGLLNHSELWEYLQGPPLKIEVHDRDRKLVKPTSAPAMYGTELDDASLSKVGLRSSGHPTCNAPCDPYGVVRVDLSELLLGQKRFKVMAPIKSSPVAHLPEHKVSKYQEPTPSHSRMVYAAGTPMGHYLSAGSQLKVKVEIAHPLIKTKDHPSLDCPFGRIIYYFRCRSGVAPKRLRTEILRINASAAHLDSYTEETIKRSLSFSKTTASNTNVDIVTGFYFHDHETHLFVLEGLRNKAIRRLWETTPVKLSGREEEQVEILYNSDLSFSNRLYETLDVSLPPIHLYESLETIMRQPLLYVRKMVPRACFQALSRLSHLLHMKRMKDVVHYELFPSAEMILSMSRRFGTVSGTGEEQVKVKHQTEPRELSRPTLVKTCKTRDAYKPEYLEGKPLLLSQQHGMETKDFIQANIEAVSQANRRLQKPKPAVTVAHLAVDKIAHNYSIQKENSTIQAWKLLHEEMAKEPTRRFTYSQEYQSATVVPVDVEEVRRLSELRSKAAWRTYDGFICLGFRSSIECNKHPRHLDEARMEELKKPWRENILNDDILRSMVMRTQWPWSKRHQDFEQYRKPSSFPVPVVPMTKHLPASKKETRKQELVDVAKVQYYWLPWKGLNTTSSKLEYIPKFKVMHMQPEALGLVDTEEEACTTGPMDPHDQSWEGVSIPRKKSEPKKLHFM